MDDEHKIRKRMVNIGVHQMTLLVESFAMTGKFYARQAGFK
jgi:hypothetical protein